MGSSALTVLLSPLFVARSPAPSATGLWRRSATGERAWSRRRRHAEPGRKWLLPSEPASLVCRSAGPDAVARTQPSHSGGGGEREPREPRGEPRGGGGGGPGERGGGGEPRSRPAHASVRASDAAADRAPLPPTEAGAVIAKAANPWQRAAPSEGTERLIRSAKGCVCMRMRTHSATPTRAASHAHARAGSHRPPPLCWVSAGC